MINSTAGDLVSASFGGDAQYATSLGSTTVTPTKAPTTLVLAASPAAPSALTTTALTATVSPVPSGGTVAFSDDDGYVSGCGSVNVNTTTGIATCSTQSLAAPGLDNFYATYSGNVSYLPSPTADLPVTIAKAVTSVVITTSPSPLVVDNRGTFIATVTGPDGPVNGGTVGFADTQGSIVAGDLCGALGVNSSGIAQCIVANVASVSNDTVTAAYAGTSLYAPSVANTNVEPNVRTTSLSVGVSSTVLVVGQSSVITATLNQPAVTGTVSFSDNKGLVSGCSSVTVDPTTSTATCTTSLPASAGSDSITVSYGGDTNDAPVSSALAVAIDSEPTMTSSASFDATVGQAFSTTITTSGTPSVDVIAINGGSLPLGLSLTDNHDGTATIAGTLSPGSGGAYQLGLALNDGVLAPVTENLSFVVDESPSFVTSSSARLCRLRFVRYLRRCIGLPDTAAVDDRTGSERPAVRQQRRRHGEHSRDRRPEYRRYRLVRHQRLERRFAFGEPALHAYDLACPAAEHAIPSPNPNPAPGGSTSGNGSGGNSTSKGPSPLVLSSYAVKASLTGAMKLAVSCSAPPTSIHDSATKGSLSELGFSLTCKAAGHKLTLDGSLTARTSTKTKRVVHGKKSVVKKVRVTNWFGAVEFAEPTQHLSASFVPTAASVNSKLVLTTEGDGVIMVHRVPKSCALRITITPRYQS